jgi:hypothetical protein
MTAPLDIIAAMESPELFGPYFKGPSWDNWKTVQRAVHCLPMTKKERAFFRTIADREPPKRRVREAWHVAGRGAGKDSITSGDIAHAAATFADQDNRARGRRSFVSLAIGNRPKSFSTIRGRISPTFRRWRRW